MTDQQSSKKKKHKKNFDFLLAVGSSPFFAINFIIFHEQSNKYNNQKFIAIQIMIDMMERLHAILI